MEPIQLDFPTEFYTDRLHIRYPVPGDGKAVHQSIEASLVELKPYMLFAHMNQTETEVEANIRESNAAFLKREDLRLLLFHKQTGDFIGSSGLHRIDWKVRKFEIGSGSSFSMEYTRACSYSPLKGNFAVSIS